MNKSEENEIKRNVYFPRCVHIWRFVFIIFYFQPFVLFSYNGARGTPVPVLNANFSSFVLRFGRRDQRFPI